MILFLDDEIDEMPAHVEQVMSKGFKVEKLSSVAELQHFLQRSRPSPQCIVLDVMFPRDTGLPDELTSSGSTTGVPIFASLRSTFPTTPIIIFTNSSNIEVKSFFHRQDNCSFYYKTDLDPLQLAELVASLAEDRGKALAKQLLACPAGIKHAAKFESIATRILAYLFIPPLKRTIARSRRSDGHEIRDLVLPNRSGTFFWESLQREFEATYIVAEFKNYTKPIGKQQVSQLREYLQRKPLGRFGLLISRQPASPSALKSRTDAYSDQNCLILFLHDKDLHRMIEIRRRGGDPATVLETMKEEFELGF
jgi:hypothetical protein